MSDSRRGGQGVGDDHPGKPKELPSYQPYRAPVVPAALGVALPDPAPSAATAPPSAPRLASDALTRSQAPGPGGEALGDLDFDALAEQNEVPDPSAALRVGAALGELGVVASLGQVAVAYAKTEFDAEAIGQSLRAFTSNLQGVGEQVMALPGVGDALMALGGLGGIASGVGMLHDALQAQAGGHKVVAAATAAAGAAKLLGGVATALSPFCPPLAALGGVLTLAGVGLHLGAMGLGLAEGQASAQEPAMGPKFLGKAFAAAQGLFTQSVQGAAALLAPPPGRLAFATAGVGAGGGDAGAGLSRIVSNHSAAMVGAEGLGAGLSRIVSNHSAAMVGPGSSPFAWLGRR